MDSKRLLPDLRQDKAYDCGDTSIRILCQFHGWALPAAGLSSPIDGTDPRTLETALRSSSIHVESGSLTLASLAHHTGQGWPVICLIQLDGIGHWVVVEKANLRTVTYQCPARGPSRLSSSQWLKAWGDIDRLGARYHQWGIVAWVGKF